MGKEKWAHSGNPQGSLEGRACTRPLLFYLESTFETLASALGKWSSFRWILSFTRNLPLALNTNIGWRDTQTFIYVWSSVSRSHLSKKEMRAVDVFYKKVGIGVSGRCKYERKLRTLFISLVRTLVSCFNHLEGECLSTVTFIDQKGTDGCKTSFFYHEEGRKTSGISTRQNLWACWQELFYSAVSCLPITELQHNLKDVERLEPDSLGRCDRNDAFSDAAQFSPSTRLQSLWKTRKGIREGPLSADHLISYEPLVQSLITASLLTCIGAKASYLLSLLSDSSSSSSCYMLLSVWSSQGTSVTVTSPLNSVSGSLLPADNIGKF